MGASESSPATPTCKPLLDNHLSHVRDPRSPTAGILRTPIEVENSPEGSPLADSEEEGIAANDPTVSWDPRSPTPGISRTPMKTVMAETLSCLVKQLSEVFVAEAPEERQVPEEFHCQGQKSQTAFVTDKVSTDEGGSREAAEMSPTLAAERNEQLSFCLSAAATAKLAPAAGVPPATGNKPTRRRTNNKLLAPSTDSGRSPLSTLQNDNSPKALASLQSKRHPSAAENQGEHRDGALNSGWSLKAGSHDWGCVNKENQQHRLVEN